MALAVQGTRVSSYLMLQEPLDSEGSGSRASQQAGWDRGKVLGGSQPAARVRLRERETRARGHLVLDCHVSHAQRGLCHVSPGHGDACIMTQIWWAKAHNNTSE